MRPGNVVDISTGKGIIKNVVKSILGENICHHAKDACVVLKLYIQPEVVNQAFPYNPVNVSEYRSEVHPMRKNTVMGVL